MRTLALSITLLTLPIFSQPRLPAPPNVDQNKRLTSTQGVGLNDPMMPDIPDPSALHTPKGRLFEQPAMSGDDIAIMYFQLTGKRVLTTSVTNTLEIKIVQPGPLTNREVAELIESKLMMEGYTLTESPGNSRQLRLVPQAGGAASGKSLGTQIITDKSMLPSNDTLITYAMRLKYIDPEEAARVFQSVVGQFGPAGTVVPVANTRTVLITDNSLLIRSLIDLKDQIDVPGSDLSTKFVELIYADAEEVAGQLEELLNGDDQQTNAPRNTAPNVPGAAGIPGFQGGGSSSGQDVPLKIVSENRTNRIILSGSPQKLALAETLIKQLDQPSSDKNSIRRTLKYLPVGEFMPIAANAIQATLGGSSTGGTGSNRANTNQPAGNNITSTGGNSNSRFGNNSNTGSFGGGGGNTGGGRASIGGQDGNTAPDSQLIGKTLLVSDNISNSIVVNGPPHHIEIVQNLLDELDTRSEQIAITAIFGKYTASKGRSFGTDIVSLFDNTASNPNFGGGGITGSTPGSVSSIFSADTLANFAANAIGTGLSLGYAQDSLGVFLNATKTCSDFTELSRPTIFTTNNRSARISSGSRIAVPTGSNNGGSNFGSSTQIEYRDVALDLEVRPLVNGVDEVTLHIALVKDSLGNTRTISTGDANLEIPDINSEELNTIVTVPNKSLIVLGGLYTDNDRNVQSKVPLLGDIPLLGRLFRNDSDSKDLSELVIMVYPQIIANTNELNSYQHQYDQKSYITPQARENFYSNSLLDPSCDYIEKETQKKSSNWWNKKYDDSYWEQQNQRNNEQSYNTQPRSTAPSYSSSTMSSFNHDRALGHSRR